ncbi:hypothetical protein V491_05558 [Pseudogymnoascus sp. VKM F-3775]|nr:hypothetical protein V491_05558 [Pseudogymnoascus sp. VKM F-3775]
MNGTENLSIRPDGGSYYLEGDCWSNTSGNFVHSELRLDDCLGNDHGRFQWGGRNFSSGARDITFEIEGANPVPVLRAELQDQGVGDYAARDVNLAERINNKDGQLTFRRR